MKKVKEGGFAIFINIIAWLVVIIQAETTSTRLTISQGELKGRTSTTRNGREFFQFLGIPYANTPVRFEAPEKPGKWEGVRDATEYKPPCMHLSILAEDVAIVAGQEDCLYLNVHTPTLEKNAKLPVMVYIRDGFFEIPGRIAEFGFQYFLDENVVLVEFAYRIGAFGFLSTGTDEVQGNMGLKDQVLALEWVQDNIQAFGGDETEVTIFGVDAGAASVSFHILSPMSEGLFNKAIAQSGSALSPWAFSHNPEDIMNRLVEVLLCPTDSTTKMIDCLKNKPAEQIAEADLKKWFNDPIAEFTPVVERIPEGKVQKSEIFLPDDPRKMYKEGRFKKVPLITGITSHQGIMHHAFNILAQKDLVTKINQPKNWKNIAAVTFYYDNIVAYDDQKDVGEKIKSFYFGQHDIGYFTVDNLTNVYSDRLFNQGVRNAAILHAKHAPVYPYIFAFLPDLPEIMHRSENNNLQFEIGAEHGRDIEYLFTLMDGKKGNDGIHPKGSVKDNFMKSYIRLWVSFAKTGKPSKMWGTEKRWPAITSNNLNNKSPIEWLKITETPHVIQDPFVERVTFWNDLLDQYYQILEDEGENGLIGLERVHFEEIEAFETRNPIVSTELGDIMGFILESRAGHFFEAYLGVPYAKPPKRFEPAESLEDWEGWDSVRNATSYGPDCIQLEHHVNPAKMNNVIGSEDCLYLNVFVPKNSGDFEEIFRPVLVVFHDHAFAHGSAKGLGGQYLVDERVIVVTVNYRLGALGFLNTGDGFVPGNLGLKDQVLALEWVQEHIYAFMGSSDKVTILGAGSGGAAAVTYHILSPMSAGLFHRAIAHSGSALCPWAFIQDPRPAALNLAERLNCPTYDSKNMIHCLKTKNVKDIVKQKFFRWYRNPMTTFGPSIEIIPSGEGQKSKVFLAEHPHSLWSSGRINRVPLILGAMRFETLILYTYGINGDYSTFYKEELNDNWKDLLPSLLYYDKLASPDKVEEISEKIKKFYIGDEDFEDAVDNPNLIFNYSNLFSDRLFIQGIKEAAILHAKYAPVYPYFFSHARNALIETEESMWGEGHEDDLEYFFFKDKHARHLSDSAFKFNRSFEPGSVDEKLSISLVKLWSSFIKSGKPTDMFRADVDILMNIPVQEWKPIDSKALRKKPHEPINWFVIENPSGMIPEPFQDRMDFWDSIVQNLENDVLSDREDFDGYNGGKFSKDEL